MDRSADKNGVGKVTVQCDLCKVTGKTMAQRTWEPE